MKLHNVIGGLEEMEYVNNTYDGPISIGHNQLCNREVEIDLDKIDQIILDSKLVVYIRGLEIGLAKCLKQELPDNKWVIDKCKEHREAISKAIEQGKVLKVIE